jgi:hypothetical protein
MGSAASILSQSSSTQQEETNGMSANDPQQPSSPDKLPQSKCNVHPWTNIAAQGVKINETTKQLYSYVASAGDPSVEGEAALASLRSSTFILPPENQMDRIVFHKVASDPAVTRKTVPFLQKYAGKRLNALDIAVCVLEMLLRTQPRIRPLMEAYQKRSVREHAYKYIDALVWNLYLAEEAKQFIDAIDLSVLATKFSQIGSYVCYCPFPEKNEVTAISSAIF